MTKPYYSDEHVTIYHADCRQILGDMPKVDLVLTDPPWGINLDTNYQQFYGTSKGAHEYTQLRKNHPKIRGDNAPFDPQPLLKYANCILWGANHYHHTLPEGGQWLIWDKRADNGHALLNDAEMAWRSNAGGVRVFDHCWHGFARASENSLHYHPTQKPIALMKWCIGLVKGTQSVIDPYMGSGATLRAAKDLGIKAIGIELEEAYCEIAARRMAQQVLPLEPPAAEPQQMSMTG